MSTRGYQTPPGQIKPDGGLTSPGETLTLGGPQKHRRTGLTIILTLGMVIVDE